MSLIGLLSLVEWRMLSRQRGADLPALAPLSPSHAIGVLLGGASLVLLAPLAPRRLRRWAGRLCALVTSAMGVLSLIETLAGSATIPNAVATGLLGRSTTDLPPPTAAASLGLLLNGVALFALGSRSRRRAAGPAIALGAAASALVALVEVATGPITQPEVTPPEQTSLLAALSLLELAAGIVGARPANGPLRLLLGDGLGHRAARCLLPALVVGPLGVGLLSLAVVEAELLAPTVAIAIGAALSLAIMVIAVVHTVRVLTAADAARRQLLDELRHDREFLRTLLRALNHGVVLLDADQRVLGVNPRWCELTGRSRDEVLGHAPPYPWEPPSGAPGRYEVVIRPDGTAVPVLRTTAPVPGPDGRPRAFVVTYVDISERVRAEEALARHVQSLEHVNDELRRANQRLEQAVAFKADLVAMVSHEISQPLSSMASLAELLVADWLALTEEVRYDLAVKVDRNARRLTTLLNDLTLLFRLDAGTVTSRRTPVSVADVVDSVIAALPTPTPEIKSTIDPDLYVLADRTHLQQIVRHLIGNALRHGQPPIEVAATPDDRHTVALTIRDHGPGVPPDAVPKLFARFGRGRGLGLFIARHLVEANNGAIRYEPAEQGARFVVHLELAPGSAPAAADAA